MIGEIVILRGKQRVDEGLRYVVEANGRAPHLAKLCDQLVIGAVDSQRDLELDAAKGIDRGQVRAEVEKCTADAEQQGAKNCEARPDKKFQKTHRGSWNPGFGRGSGDDAERENRSHYMRFFCRVAICASVKAVI